MFFVNMLGAIILLPALATWFWRAPRPPAAQATRIADPGPEHHPPGIGPESGDA
jgi:hypothetical protein